MARRSAPVGRLLPPRRPHLPPLTALPPLDTTQLQDIFSPKFGERYLRVSVASAQELQNFGGLAGSKVRPPARCLPAPARPPACL